VIGWRDGLYCLLIVAAVVATNAISRETTRDAMEDDINDLFATRGEWRMHYDATDGFYQCFYPEPLELTEAVER
jgi:hypothetical protein